MNGGNKEIASSLCKKTKVNNLLQAVNSAKSCHSVATTYQLCTKFLSHIIYTIRKTNM